MIFSVSGESELMDWQSASKLGGRSHSNLVPSFESCFNVDAWLPLPDRSPIKVSGLWMSSMDEVLRKAFLKELDLPVTKELVYKVSPDVAVRVSDICIGCVWEGCYSLLVKLDNGKMTDLPINSSYFSEMNAGKTELSESTLPKKPDYLADLPSRYVVFDLEATSQYPDSADICEIGALLVEDNEVVDEFEQLVYIDGEMPASAYDVHGIPKDDLEDAPHATAAVSAFLDFVGDGSVIVGQNLDDYDIPLMRRVAKLCGREFRYADSIDTLPLAKKAWPKLSSHSMDYLRLLLHIDGEGHRALKDCHDEWQVLKFALSAIATGEPALEDDLDLLEQVKKKKESKFSKRSNMYRSSRKKAKEFSPTTSEFDSNHPLYEKNVVITGDIDDEDPNGAYNDAMQQVCDFGGHPQDNVTMKTDIVVVGRNPGKGKLPKAQQYRDERGLPIDIMKANEFAALLDWAGDDMQADQPGIANAWLIACPKGSYAKGDSILYILYSERKRGSSPKRPNDGTQRETVASGWFSPTATYAAFAAQPWYEKPNNGVWQGKSERDYIYLHERIGKVQVLDTWSPVDGETLFDGLCNCIEFDLRKMDTSSCKSFRGMFRGCTSVMQLLDIDKFSTPSLTDTSYMFMNCLSLRAVSIAGWDVSNIVNCEYMLSGCSPYVLVKDQQIEFLNRIMPNEAESGFWRRSYS